MRHRQEIGAACALSVTHYNHILSYYAQNGAAVFLSVRLMQPTQKGECVLFEGALNFGVVLMKENQTKTKNCWAPYLTTHPKTPPAPN